MPLYAAFAGPMARRLDKGAEKDDQTPARRCCTPPARRVTSTRRGCCWRKARRSTGRTRTGTPLEGKRRSIGACCGERPEVDRARGCCWRKARRSRGQCQGGDGTKARRRCSPPARVATSTRRGCCWTKARNDQDKGDAAAHRRPSKARLLLEKGAEVDRRTRSNAAIHRLPERPRRRGAAARERREGERTVDKGSRPELGTCWTRRSTGRRGGGPRCSSLPARTACRRGAAVAGQRRRRSQGHQQESNERRRGTASAPLFTATRCRDSTYIEVVRLLLANGADVDREDEDGKTRWRLQDIIIRPSSLFS